MSGSATLGHLTDVTAEVIVSPWYPARYAAVVVGALGRTLVFCGHLHRTRKTAEHCATGIVGNYQSWMRAGHQPSGDGPEARAGHVQ